MGRKLDALLGRTFKIPNLKTHLNLTLSRLAILTNQRKVRCTQARNDVSELLKLSQEERALLRVEHVVKEQNMLDAFVIIEGCCHVLIERGVLIETQKSCHEELKEAISGLAFAASRCGELPELQELRAAFTTRFGKEFTAAAVELRNGCGVNAKLIQKMSTRQPSLEIRLKVLREIASQNGITLKHFEQGSSEITEEFHLNQSQPKPNKQANVGGSSESSIRTHRSDFSDNSTEFDRDEAFLGGLKARKKYRDVETAAKAAFESAAYAAEAARAAVELARTESQERGSDDQGPSPRRQAKFDENKTEGSSRSRFRETRATVENEHSMNGSRHEKLHPVQNSNPESENEEPVVKPSSARKEERSEKSEAQLQRSVSASRTDSTDTEISSKILGSTKPLGKDILFDESGDEIEKGSDGSISDSENSELGFDEKSRSAAEIEKSSVVSSRASDFVGKRSFGFENGSNFDAVSYNEDPKLHHAHQKQTPVRSPTYNSHEHMDNEDSPGFISWRGSKIEDLPPASGLPKKFPQKGSNFVSVRTRRGPKQ